MSIEMSDLKVNGSSDRPLSVTKLKSSSFNGYSASPSSGDNYLSQRFQHSVLINGNSSNNGSDVNANDENYELTYEDTIAALNGLQSNAQTIEKIRKEKGSNSCHSLSKTFEFLSLLNIKPEDLNALNVIHVSGTKGKGSTCAFTESILRQYGYKTAFYSSPHLIEVRERFRVNGVPISKDEFIKYFWVVYNTIEKNRGSELGMPPYFMFLTLMAYKYFLEQNCDVTILEVGIGGEYDCTNVVPKPIVTGVTSLGYDHCSILGSTIDKIAWQKAGIFKQSVHAFTVQQCDEAMNVLRARARERNCTLHVCPALSLYPKRDPIKLGISGEVQKLNASLALQLANTWLQKKNNISYQPSTLITKNGLFADVFTIDDRSKNGLSLCSWPGRCHIFNKGNVTYFMDGAHTTESMAHCSKWYLDESNKLSVTSKCGNNITRIMIFNSTGERNPDSLMKSLKARFDYAIFCPNRVTNVKDVASDQSNFTVTPQREIEQCAVNAASWQKVNDGATIVKLSCISDAIDFINQKDNKMGPIHVLVTGSIHLVGCVLGIIDPELTFYR